MHFCARLDTPKSCLGVKWSQVQILSARRTKLSLSSVGGGLSQVAHSMPSAQWAKWVGFYAAASPLGHRPTIAIRALSFAGQAEREAILDAVCP